MKKLLSDCPAELMLALALAQRFQSRIDQVMNDATTDPVAMRRLLDWVESLTTSNCWWVEYEVANEITSHLQAQGFPVKTGSQAYRREAAKAPKGLMDDAETFNKEAFTGSWAAAKVVEKDEALRAKTLEWITATQRSGTWASRWIAKRLSETINLTWPSTEVTRVIMETD